MPNDSGITALLQAAANGERGALDTAFERVYAHLKGLARAQLRRAPDATLSTTALVHETWLKFSRAERIDANNREHFYNLAARAMRQILLDRARSLLALRNVGEGAARATLPDDAGGESGAISAELIDLERALRHVELLDARLGVLVELRLFGGLDFAEIADLRGVSERTALRDWRKARAILAAQLAPATPD